jgi:type VI secretion system protein ImpG
VDHQSDLLPYFQRELGYLRQAGAAFARRYPKIAERLELGEHASSDPHVERLIEAFAFLTGRIQHQLDQDFPRIPEALLEVLYPHFLEPVPSLTIARFHPDPEQGDLGAGYRIARHTPLLADGADGTPCRFRTCYPLVLWPIEVAEVAFEPPTRYDFLDRSPDVAAVLRIRLERLDDDALGALPVDRLRFHLGGDRRRAFALYDLLFAHTRGVALLHEGEARPRLLPADVVQEVGFAPEEAVLPHRPRSHQAYRLVQEYFCFPDKFLFVDLAARLGEAAGRRLDVLMLLREPPAERLDLDPDAFMLGCTPIANLFEQTSEPIRLDHARNEYRLVPDARREATTEVHSIIRVTMAADAADTTRPMRPFFSIDHAGDPAGEEPAEAGAYWLARRRSAAPRGLAGTDVHLSFQDLAFEPSMPAASTVWAHTLCTNRGLADELPPFAVLQAEQQLPTRAVVREGGVLRPRGGAAVALAKPTRQLDPAGGGATLWRLVSHLSLNHLSLSGDAAGLQALREILGLYSFVDHASVAQQIAGLRDVTCRRVVRRVGREAWRGFCTGTEVTLTVDQRPFVGGSALLLGAVLARFLALHAAIESFTQLRLARSDREGIWKTWPATAGDRPLL